MRTREHRNDVQASIGNLILAQRHVPQIMYCSTIVHSSKSFRYTEDRSCHIGIDGCLAEFLNGIGKLDYTPTAVASVRLQWSRFAA